ncbi:MAG: carbamoyltransferase HypF, partial [Acidobacteriota bacterium]
MDTHAREPSRGGADVGHDVTLGATRRRQCLAIEGLVQGVGFRPFVFGLAKRLGLRGTVSNVDGGVLIDIDGAPRELGAFRRGLESEAPPLARIDSVVEASLPPRASPTPDFQIVASGGGGGVSLVSPDVSLCGACRREMRDPADRRYGYAFINCTDCGPRFTIVTGTPYDRPLTTMADFVMCPACRSEYEDPASRRFHAQPVACPECGPRTLWRGDDGAASGDGPVGDAAVAAARTALAEGKIVAVKGIGGFHLACDATADAAVAELRRRKGRPHKPLAVMVKDLEAARRYAEVSAGEAELLGGAERPIVLLAARSGAGLAPQVAPGQGTVGLMLPYSPLHELLLGERPLVMTSGNLSGEPIVKDFETARARLGGVADGFLDHDRPIHTVCDDSVVRRVAGGTSFLRRSRGYAPSPLALPREAPPLLAVGGELKSVFCLAAGRRAFLSQHLGDVASPDTLEAFERAYVLMRELFDITPEVVACDLHPGYLSSQWAAKLAAS